MKILYTKKKFILGILIVGIALVLGYQYRAYHPNLQIGIGGAHGLEIIHVVYSEPMAREIQENLIEFGDWNEEATYVLFTEALEPRDIKAYGKVEDGKTTFRYEGYYTTKDGETIQFLEEKTFDFELPLEEELLK